MSLNDSTLEGDHADKKLSTLLSKSKKGKVDIHSNQIRKVSIKVGDRCTVQLIDIGGSTSIRLESKDFTLYQRCLGGVKSIKVEGTSNTYTHHSNQGDEDA